MTDRIQWVLRAAQNLGNDRQLARAVSTQSLKEIHDLLLANSASVANWTSENLDPGVKALSMEELMQEYLINALAAQDKSGGLVKSYQPKIQFNKVSKVYAECVESLSTSESNLPEDKEIESFMKGVPALRSKIKKALNGRFSTVTQAVLNQYIDDVQFSPPPSKINYLQNVIGYLKERANQKRRALETYLHDPDKGLLLMGTGSDENTGSVAEQLGMICKRLTYRPIRDNTLTALGAVAVGSQAIKNPNFAVGVESHEVGHGLFNVLSTSKTVSEHSRKIFADAKSCLLARHKDLFDKIDAINVTRQEDQRDHRPRDYYLNEDFADTIAGIVTPRPNFWCPMLFPGTDLEDVTMHSEDVPENHSRDTFRIFNIEVQSGREMDSSCKEFLKANNFDLKKCL